MSSNLQSKRKEVVLVDDQNWDQPLKNETYPIVNFEKDTYGAKLRVDTIATSTIVMPSTPASYTESK